ncbi:MAG: radical SAM protein [Hungatella sp.]
MEKNILNELSEDWQGLETIVLYGWGNYAKKVYPKLIEEFTVEYIIDNDDTKSGQTEDGVQIVTFETVREKDWKGKKIIVATHTNAYESISQSLSDIGLVEHQDYCKLELFLLEWYWKYRRQANLFVVHTSITSRCTFHCQNCNMFMPYYKTDIDYSFADIKKDLDSLFKHIDYVYDYELLGGEPFLNKELGKIIEYLVHAYGKRIGQIGVITNGSLIPDQTTLNILKKNRIVLSLSDYTGQIDYKPTFDRLVSCMQSNGIPYRISSAMRWTDFGLPQHPCNYEDIRQHMNICGPSFHGLNDEKFYYCHVSWSAEKCGLIQLQETDFINFKTMNCCDEEKEKLMLFSLGKWTPGYVSMCKVCGGCGNDNQQTIPAGIQMKRA